MRLRARHNRGGTQYKITFPHYIVEWRVAVRAAWLRDGEQRRVSSQCWLVEAVSVRREPMACCDRPAEGGASGQHADECQPADQCNCGKRPAKATGACGSHGRASRVRCTIAWARSNTDIA